MSRIDSATLGKMIATRQRRPDMLMAGMGLPNPDPILKALGRDIEVYKDLRSHSRVGGAIRRRKGAVKAMEWGIDRDKPRSRASKSIEAMLRDLDLDRILGEILDAPLYGYQPLEVMWGKVGGKPMPVDLIGKPANWFGFDAENRLRFKSTDNFLEGELLPDFKFIVPRQDASYENPYGVPDLGMCFWPVAFIRGGMKFWVTFTEKYGSPWVIGKQPRGTESKETDLLLDDLEQMIQDAVGVIPDDSSVEIVEASGKAASAEVYRELVMVCRSDINVALLGQDQTTEATANKASAAAGADVTDDIRDAHASIVCATMNQLIRWVWDRNYGGSGRPVFEMWEQEDVDVILAERDAKLKTSGANFSNQYYEREYQLQPGDLLPQVNPEPNTPPPAGQSVEFADAGESFADQDQLDAALATLQANLQAQLDPMLKPLIDAVNGATDYADALEAISELYPSMDMQKLQQTLERATFVAELWGFANGMDDADFSADIRANSDDA